MATFVPQFARLSVGLTTSTPQRSLFTGASNEQEPQSQTPPTSTAAAPNTQQPLPTTQNIAGKEVKPPSLRQYPYSIKAGTVASVGKMDRTVRVAYRHTTYDQRLRKTYPKVTHFLVADPRNSLREGDVIEFASGFPKSRTVHHVVERIVAPFGTPIDQRPPVMSREERDTAREEKRAAKWERREQRRAESGEKGPESQEHVGRIRRLVLERTVARTTRKDRQDNAATTTA